MNLISRLTAAHPKLKIVAVSKGRSKEELKEMLIQTGLESIAENRLKEAEEKLKELPEKLEKHFIGKLQSRKIPKIVELFDVIQSVENLEQAKIISAQEKDIKVFLQVNIARIPQRSGCKPEEAEGLIKAIKQLPHIELAGVMGIASQEPNKARNEFKLLKSLQGDLPECSMGMSGDYQIALEEDSTMLRLGRILFEDSVAF